MAIEIERKFLVHPKSNEWRLQANRRNLFRQGVLFKSDEGNRILSRVRVVEDNPPVAFLTVKQRLSNNTRNEFEYNIPYADAMFMLDNMCIDRVEKIRYCVPIGNKPWVVDEYLGVNAGLVVAEIELQSEDEEIIDLPAWIDYEITSISEYIKHDRSDSHDV